MAKRVCVQLESSLYEAVRAYAVSGEYTEVGAAARDLMRQALASNPDTAAIATARQEALAEVQRWAMSRLRTFFHALSDEISATTAAVGGVR